MPSTKSLAYVLPLVCLVSWQCGRSNPADQRRDAAKDQTGPAGVDSGPDTRQADLGADLLASGHDTTDIGLAPAIDAPSSVADAGYADVGLAADLRNPEPWPDGGPDVASGRDGTPEAGIDQRAAPDGSVDGAAPMLADGSSDALIGGNLDSSIDVLIDGSRGPTFAETGGRCNNLVDEGILHDVVNVAGPAPTPLGGPIEDGLYYETASQYFDTGMAEGPTGEQRRLTMLVTGQTMQVVYVSSDDGISETETDQMDADLPDAEVGAVSISKICPADSIFPAMLFHYSFVGSGRGATFTLIYPSWPEPSGHTPTFVLTLTRQ